MARSALFSLDGVVVDVAFGHGEVVDGAQLHEVVHGIVGASSMAACALGLVEAVTTS